MASRHSGGGRGRGRFRKHNKNAASFHQDKESKKDVNVDESSPVIQAFRIFQKELDSRNDRHERIVKLSRDITIESKRIIFLLQRCAGSGERETVLAEAAAKFEELYSTKFYPLALELEGQDPHQFLRAFSPGLQEFIEALTFYHYLLGEHLIGLDKIKTDLTFKKKRVGSEKDASATVENLSISTSDASSTEKGENPSTTDTKMDTTPATDTSTDGEEYVVVPILPSEYMLGVADFTGELMRMAINSVGAGDLETPALVTNMMRKIHGAFTTFGNPPREFRQKTRVLFQSLQKVEQACYTLRVRGSEIPQHMLADVFSSGRSMPDSFTVDEGDEQFE